MNLNKAEHKLLVHNLFLENGKEKHFPLAKLAQAASVQKKIIDDAKHTKNDEGVIVSYEWEDSDMKLTLDEAVFVKELVNSLGEAAPSQYKIIQSLRDLLEK